MFGTVLKILKKLDFFFYEDEEGRR